jgi:alkanesulfonate monooxygenase SsuD/methylene tetrahydromethanopterin reductase-like flavin-dependent oxidoreductase (luciferase family)
VKLGVLLPTFREGADDALARADEVAAAGLDGVFAYDHLWPMGSPERPSLAPFALLAAIAARHRDLWIAPLVARVTLVGTEHLVRQFTTLSALAPGRVIAALGTGDHLGEAENRAYGLDALDAAGRRMMLRDAAQALRSWLPVWIGAGGDATNNMARELGVEINLWDYDPERVAQMALAGPVNWAGPVPSDLPATLDGLERAGATWAVFSPQVSIDELREWRVSR